MKNKLKTLPKDKILVLDGAMGTMIQRYKLTETDFRGEKFANHHLPLIGNNDVLSLTKPEIIEAIHLEYLKAGADIIETNTFSSTSIAQEDYGLQEYVYEINKQSAEIAKKACKKYLKGSTKKQCFVAGAIGPTNKTASMSPDVNDPGYRAVDFDTLANAYYHQAKGLQDGGIDIFLIETVFDTLNAKAALIGIKKLEQETQKQIPVMISGTITDSSGRTLSGQTAEAFYISLIHSKPLSIGFNCALGAKQLQQHLEVLNKCATCMISAHPNAGLPNEMGEYDETPQQMAKQIEEYLKLGLVNIIGGCCGTTPDHIIAIAQLTTQYQPRQTPA